MKPAVSLTAIVEAILANPAPVLVADTCSVLDVTRSLYRPEAPSHSLAAGRSAVRASASVPTKLHIVIFDQIENEIEKHLAGETARLRTQMIKLTSAGSVCLSRFNQFIWSRCVRQIEAELAEFPKTWEDSGHRVSLETSCVPRARARLIGGIKPGNRGSANLGDCLIAEHLLELAARLRNAGFNKEILFVSSNAKDFGTSVPKEPLDIQFASVLIDFYQNLQGATTQLGL